MNSNTQKVGSTSRKPTKNGKLSTTSGGRASKDSGGSRYNEIYKVLNEALDPVDWEKLNISGLHKQPHILKINLNLLFLFFFYVIISKSIFRYP